MSDHILHITEVTKYGTEYDLECVGHDKKTCNLQTWWFNEWDDLLKLDPIDIPIPVRAEWNNSDEPTIVLAAAEPAVTITWDGTDAAHGAIEELLRPLGVTILLDDIDADELDEPMPALQLRNISSAFPTVGFITPMGSIRAEGDSFAILPPEVAS